MAKNLRGQLNWAINSNFREGIDKDSYKKENGHSSAVLVFGYTSRKNLLDFSKNLSNWVKENHPECNRYEKLTPEICQDFLNDKAKTCRQTTLDTYAYNLNKLEILGNKTHDVDLKYSEEIVTPLSLSKEESARGVQAQIPRADYDRILDRARESESQSAYAVRLQEYLCVRVEEVVHIKLENIDYENGTVLLHCKHGKDLVRQLNDESSSLLKEIESKGFGEERLFTVEGDSVNKWIRETEDLLGLDRHSFHDIRRTLAQEFYDDLRENGMSIKEAANTTSEFLNHGRDRLDMLKECYIILR